MQIELDASGVRPGIDHDIDFKVFHRGIEIFFNNRIEAMDFINEQDVPFIKVRQDAGEVKRLVDRRSRGDLDLGIHLVRYDVGKSCFTEAGRTGQEYMVECLAALFGSLDKDLEVRDDLILSRKLPELVRAQSAVEFGFILDSFGSGSRRFTGHFNAWGRGR